MDVPDPNHVTGMQAMKNTMNSSGFKRCDYMTNSSGSEFGMENGDYKNKKIRYKHP